MGEEDRHGGAGDGGLEIPGEAAASGGKGVGSFGALPRSRLLACFGVISFGPGRRWLSAPRRSVRQCAQRRAAGRVVVRVRAARVRAGLVSIGSVVVKSASGAWVKQGVVGLGNRGVVRDVGRVMVARVRWGG